MLSLLLQTSPFRRRMRPIYPTASYPFRVVLPLHTPCLGAINEQSKSLTATLGKIKFLTSAACVLLYPNWLASCKHQTTRSAKLCSKPLVTTHLRVRRFDSNRRVAGLLYCHWGKALPLARIIPETAGRYISGISMTLIRNVRSAMRSFAWEHARRSWPAAETHFNSMSNKESMRCFLFSESLVTRTRHAFSRRWWGRKTIPSLGERDRSIYASALWHCNECKDFPKN